MSTQASLKSVRRLGVYIRRLLVLLLLLALLSGLLLYVAMGTEQGSRLIVERIAQSADIRLQYQSGSLRHGLQLGEIAIAQSDMDIHINHADIQMGLKALLTGQVYISKADIGTITISDYTPPNDEPFTYPTIRLPVGLVLEQTAIEQVRYEKATQDPVILSKLHWQKAHWYQETIHIQEGYVNVDDSVAVAKINGKIALVNDYPLSITALVAVSALTEHYVAPIHIQATGSLKHTTGTLTGQYNQSPVSGQFELQSMHKDTPFSASLTFDRLALPYASEQNIVLSGGVLTAQGVLSDTKINLHIDTQMTGRDVPTGHYQGGAVIDGDGMVIDKLTAKTVNGELMATGQMNWRDDFYLTSTIKSQDFQLAYAPSSDYDNYREYLPSRLDGQIRFNFWANDQGKTRYQLALEQRDGEQVYADISQMNSNISNSDTNDNPWHIRANWQALRRTQLSGIGDINSPKGQLTVISHGQQTQINADMTVANSSLLPKGHYTANANLVNSDLYLKAASYQGVMGDLRADGVVHLPTDKRLLSYQINATSQQLLVNAYFDKPNQTSIDTISGQTRIIGHTTQEVAQTTTQTHHIKLTHSNLTAVLQDKKSVQWLGDANASVQLGDKGLEHFRASLDGRLVTTNIHAGLADNVVRLRAFGDSKQVQLAELALSAGLGKVNASGVIRLDDGVAWDIQAKLDRLDTTQLHDKSQAILTGRLISTGKYKQTLLSATADFEGQVANHRSDLGQLAFYAVAAGSKVTVNRLQYQGQAGSIHATGWVDTAQGVVATINSSMQDFDLGYFVKDYPSQLTGKLVADMNWQADEQQIRVASLDIHGSANRQPVHATGSFDATLQLPSDFQAYMNNLKNNRFHLDSLLKRQEGFYGDLMNLKAGQGQGNASKPQRQARPVIKALDVRNLQLRFGDNQLVMDGNQHRLALDINAQALSQIAPTVRGQVVGGAVLIAENNSLPTIYADLTISGLSLSSFAIRQGSVLARVVNLGNSDSAVVVQAVGVVAAGRNIRQARMDINGTVQRHNLAAFIHDGNLMAQSRIQGGFDGQQYQGVVSEGRLQTQYGALNQRQPTEIQYDVNQARLTVAAHCWQTFSSDMGDDHRGSLCLTDTLRVDKNQGKVNVVVQALDMAVLMPILPSDLTVKGRLSGKIDAEWNTANKQSPQINAKLYSDNGYVGLRNEGLPDTTMAYERISLIAQSVPTGLKLRADIKAGEAGNGYVDVVVNPYAKDKTLAGALVLNRLQLGVLRPFFPAVRQLDGEVNVAGGVGGTLASPLFFGNATLSEGRLALADAPLALQHIQLDAQIRGTTAKLDGSFASGAGTGSLSGVVDWQQQLQARLSVLGSRLQVSNPPLLAAVIDPHLEIVVRPTQKYVDVKGVIAIPTATIRPPETTADVIKESPDVVVIDRRMTGRVEDILAQVEPWSINADIGIDLGDEVVFRGFGAKLPLAGALHLTQMGQGSLQARGVVQVSERTSVDIVGQNLELNYAQLRFDGSLTNPRLSVEAVREIEGQTIGLRITDHVANPDIRVFNNAGLSDEQAMNALALGRLSDTGATQMSAQGFRAQVTNSLAAAGLNIGLQGTHGLTNELGRAIGLESLVLDASGTGNNTHLNLTGYINPDLYVRYGVGIFNAESRLSMRYRLTRRIYLEATRATENIIDVVYRVRF